MIFLRAWFVSGVVLAALGTQAAPTFAQTPPIPPPGPESRISAWLNFGAQAGSGDLTQHLTPTIYDEPATMDVAQTYESGPLVDVGGGYFFHGNFGAGLSYSHTSGDGNATIAAQIPNPLFADQPRAAVAQANGLKHIEDQVHIFAMYRLAISPKMDVTFGIGPTFFSVKQELVSTVNVTEPTLVPPFGTPTLEPVVIKGSDSAVGVNISGDFTYMISNRFGAGVLLRYAESTANIDDNGTTTEVRAGGFQFGVGARIRF